MSVRATRRTRQRQLSFECFLVPRASCSFSRRGLSRSTRRLWGQTGDTGFEVRDFRTSGHFRFKSKLEDSLLKAWNHLNLQSLTFRQHQKRCRKSEMNGSPRIQDIKYCVPRASWSSCSGLAVYRNRRLWGRKWFECASRAFWQPRCSFALPPIKRRYAGKPQL